MDCMNQVQKPAGSWNSIVSRGIFAFLAWLDSLLQRMIQSVCPTQTMSPPTILPFEPSKLPEPWNRVVDYWRRCGVKIRPGASAKEIAAFEAKYHVVLPDDVRDYFSSVDGMVDSMIVNGCDNDTNCFWPLSRVLPVHEVLSGGVCPEQFAYPDCFVIGDHCILSYYFAVRLTNTPSHTTPVYRVLSYDPPGEQKDKSFRDFMTKYADDPVSIIL